MSKNKPKSVWYFWTCPYIIEIKFFCLYSFFKFICLYRNQLEVAPLKNLFFLAVLKLDVKDSFGWRILRHGGIIVNGEMILKWEVDTPLRTMHNEWMNAENWMQLSVKLIHSYMPAMCVVIVSKGLSTYWTEWSIN